MKKYASPCNDYVFKKLFGTENHENLTKSFLNAVLSRKKGNLIQSISFKETENVPLTADGRISFLDVYCIDEQGKHFIIEMQNKYQEYFFERMIYYISFVFSRQKPSPFKYESLVPVIFIGVLNHVFDETHDDVISKYAITNLKSHEVASEHTIYYLIELPKFKKTEHQLKSDIDKWLFFMQQADQFNEIPKIMQKDENFVEAFATLESMGWSDNDWLAYFASEDIAGRDERIEKGAFKRGEQTGLQQGKHEKAIETTMKLLKKKMSFEEIADITGLTIEQVMQLQDTK